jgi:hypothetical protein
MIDGRPDERFDEPPGSRLLLLDLMRSAERVRFSRFCALY